MADQPPDEPSAEPPTLAQKLDHLFSVVRPAKGEYTYDYVSKAIEAAGGPTVSAAYIWQLRKGVRDNPTKKHLEALSDFFGVPPSYFFDEEDAHKVDTELELLIALRDLDVRQVALRAAGLSPAALQSIRGMIEQARRIEGLPEGQPED